MAATKKSYQKARDPNKLHEDKIAITAVGPSGEPVTLEDIAKSYSKMLGCILRKTASIGSKDFVGHKENLLLALNHCCELPPDVKKLAEDYAMSKWPKMLRDWKSSARCNLVGKDFETVKRLNPTMDHEEWMKFCESFGSESSKEINDHFCNLQKNLPGNHRLGPGGYKATISKWEKEVVNFEATGKPHPFLEHRDRLRDFHFPRARAVRDPETNEFVLPTAQLRSTEESL